MVLLYERNETPDEVIIVYKGWLLFYVMIITYIVLEFIFDIFIKSPAAHFWLIAIFFILIIVFIIDSWKPNREIRRALKENVVQVSGSKFSLRNPFIVVIKKNNK